MDIWKQIAGLVLVVGACQSNADRGYGQSGDGDETSGDPSDGSDTAPDPSDGSTTGDPDPEDGSGTSDGSRFDVGGEGPGESTCESVKLVLTNVGCEFAAVVGKDHWQNDWAVVAANTSEREATVELVSKDGDVLESGLVGVGSHRIFRLEGAVLDDHELPVTTAMGTKTMVVRSDVPIVAYQFAPFTDPEGASADASLLYPRHTWDDDHIVGLYEHDANTFFLVASLEEDNAITISAPSGFEDSTYDGAGLVDFGITPEQSVTLGAQGLLRVVAGARSDLTGFRVRSEKPVAVFAGSPGMTIPAPWSMSARDYLEDQVPPRAIWGNRYAGVKFRERGGEVDLYRFIAGEAQTAIELSGGYTDTLLLAEVGDFIEIQTTESFFAEGDKPFLMEHLMVSQDQTEGPVDTTRFPGDGQSGHCIEPDNTTHVGDPAISFPVPIDQFRTHYTFLTPDVYAWDQLSVVGEIATWGQIRLDGTPLPVSPTPLGNSGWGAASFPVDDGPHTIENVSPIGIEVYGYDCYISYAYPGGLDLSKINPVG